MWFAVGLLIGCSLGFVLGCWWYSLSDDAAPAEAFPARRPLLGSLESRRTATEAQAFAHLDYVDDGQQASRYQLR